VAWFKIDDRFHSHPKVVQAGNAAVGAWVRMGAWCSDHLTDGHIPAQVATMIATSEQLEALHTVGLLAGTDSGWQIPDWLDFNPSADEVRATRVKRSAAASKAGSKSATQRQRKTNADSNAEPTQTQRSTERASNAESTPHPYPHPIKTTTTAAPVDNCPSFADDVAAQFALIGARQAEQRGIKIGNMHGYLHALELAALSNPDLQRLLAQFPHAPADVIAAALHGDKHSLGYFAEPAPVIQLHSEQHHVD
jgi:hypothetical protein